MVIVLTNQANAARTNTPARAASVLSGEGEIASAVSVDATEAVLDTADLAFSSEAQ